MGSGSMSFGVNGHDPFPAYIRIYVSRLAWRAVVDFAPTPDLYIELIHD